eukprot:5728624-Pyramimonas_sp.AAC.1
MATSPISERSSGRSIWRPSLVCNSSRVEVGTFSLLRLGDSRHRPDTFTGDPGGAERAALAANKASKAPS